MEQTVAPPGHAEAQPPGLHLAELKQLPVDLHGAVDRDGEADPRAAAVHRCVDADQLAVDVEQRPAAVARVDRRVGLDEVVVGPALGADHALDGRDNPGGDGVAQPEGVADGDHRLADHQVVGAAHLHRGEALAAPGQDAQHRQVQAAVRAHQQGGVGAVVSQLDLDLPRAGDDVLVGQHIAPGIHHHARAQGAGLALGYGVAAEELVEEGILSAEGAAAAGLLGEDVDHRGAGSLHGDHHRGAAAVLGRSAGCGQQRGGHQERYEHRARLGVA